METLTPIPTTEEERLRIKLAFGDLVAVSYDSLLKMTPKPFPWLANNIIPEEALTIIAGKTGCGKSLIAFYFADRISKGKDILNNPALNTKRTNVLIVDQEMNEDDHIDRAHKIVQEGGNNVYVMYEQSFKMDNEAKVEQLLDFCKEKKIGLIIFDTFSKIHLKDENNNSEMTQVMDKLVNICRTQHLSIIAIHHYNKSLEATDFAKSRGASSIVDNCASFLEVKSQKNVNEFGYDVLSVGIEQHKSRRNITISEFGIEVINMPDGKLLFEYKDKMSQANDILEKYMTLVLGYITNHPGLPKSHIIKNLRDTYKNDKAMTYGIIKDCISSLLFKKLVREEASNKNSKLIYPVNDIEQEEIKF